MLNNMLTSIGTLTFGQSLVLSGIGMSVVLLELAILHKGQVPFYAIDGQPGHIDHPAHG